MTYYTRLTYNTENWQKPSGANGKSRNQNIFEGLNKFGFEEWLFDISNNALINGLKYGFIQGLVKSVKLRLQPEPIIFYIIDSITHDRVIVGEITEWNYVCKNTANAVKLDLKANGFINEMRKQLLNVGGVINIFDETVNGNAKEPLLNVCYKPEDLKVYADPINGNSLLKKLNRYQLYKII